MKDLGTPKRFLGIDIKIEKDQPVFINMKTYIEKMLKTFNMQDCHPVATSMVTRQSKKNKEKISNELVQNIPYREARKFDLSS